MSKYKFDQQVYVRLRFISLGRAYFLPFSAQNLGNKMDKKINAIDSIDQFFLTVERGKVYPKVIADTEKLLIEKALQHSFGNQLLAAEILGVNRNTLRTKVKKFNIDVNEFKL